MVLTILDTEIVALELELYIEVIGCDVSVCRIVDVTGPCNQLHSPGLLLEAFAIYLIVFIIAKRNLDEASIVCKRYPNPVAEDCFHRLDREQWV